MQHEAKSLARHLRRIRLEWRTWLGLPEPCPPQLASSLQMQSLSRRVDGAGGGGGGGGGLLSDDDIGHHTIVVGEEAAEQRQATSVRVWRRRRCFGSTRGACSDGSWPLLLQLLNRCHHCRVGWSWRLLPSPPLEFVCSVWSIRVHWCESVSLVQICGRVLMQLRGRCESLAHEQCIVGGRESALQMVEDAALVHARRRLVVMLQHQ